MQKPLSRESNFARTASDSFPIGWKTYLLPEGMTFDDFLRIRQAGRCLHGMKLVMSNCPGCPDFLMWIIILLLR